MDYKSVQFAIAIYVLQSFCVFYVFDKHIISHGRSILNTPYYLTVTMKYYNGTRNLDHYQDILS